jgi:uncharacterized protein DUF2272/N-acetylmuramoyl-L-alanine amidase-like protein
MTAWNERRFGGAEDEESPFLMEALSLDASGVEGVEDSENESDWNVELPSPQADRADVADEQELDGFASHATDEALARLEPLLEAESSDDEFDAYAPFSPSVLFESPVVGVQPAWRAALERGVLLADMASGLRSENDLTNKIFYLRHPDKKGAKIGQGDDALKQEWLHIRDRQVIPCLLAGPYIGPMHKNGTSGALPDLRKGVPADAVLSPLAITLRGLRKAPHRQPGTIAAIVVHMTSRGPAKRSKASGYRTPAVQYALNHYINGAEGFPHYVIDFNGTIHATCDERLVAHHSGWVHPGGRDLFASGWRAPEWWSRIWSRHGARTPIDLLPKGVRSPNSRTLGVELMILPDLSYTAEQYRALARLVVDIRQRYPDVVGGPVPNRGLLGHEDFAPVTGKGGRADARGGWDPGAHRSNPYFDWGRLSNEIQDIAGVTTVPEVDAWSSESRVRFDGEDPFEIRVAGDEDDDSFRDIDEQSSLDDETEPMPLFEQEAGTSGVDLELDAVSSDETVPFPAEEMLDDDEDASPYAFEPPDELEEEQFAYTEDEDDAEPSLETDAFDLEATSPVWAGLRQRIVSAAIREWNRWGQGRNKETDQAMRDALRSYWQNVGLSSAKADEKIRNRNPWSATFISWIMMLVGAGAAFKRSAAHYVYVAAAKRNRINNDQSNPFWAYRITEVAPQVGDLVCKARKPPKSSHCSAVTYDNIDNGNYWAAHCDIVTEVRPNEITVMGGNVKDSVAEKTITTAAGGFLPEKARDGCRFIAVVKVRDGSAASPPASPAGKADDSSGLAALPGALANMVRTGGLALKVALAMLAGERDVQKLTSMLFYLRHPERGGARIRADETQLAKEWREIRDRIVKPALDRFSAQTPSAASTDSSVAAATGDPATSVPVGPFGTLTIRAPERLRLDYEFTPQDVLWTARLVEGEAGGEDNPENVAVVWALVNRFGIFRKDLPDKTFADFIRRYSTTLQPYLRNPDAISRAIETSGQNPGKPALRWVELGDTFSYKGRDYPKGQYQKHLELQKKPWSQLKKGSRLVAERVLGGRVSSPVGLASDFDGTHIFLNRSLRKAGRNPSMIPADEYRRLWVDFTLKHAQQKNRIWIGEHVPGLQQMKSNVFYIHPRTRDLPRDTVRIMPARQHH